jgi:DNA-binding transcriptional ArsR family regulator
MSKESSTAKLEEGAREVAQLLKTMAHPNRLIIACQLTAGEKSVGEIEANAGIPQPHLSRELAKLRTAGLVKARRKSKNVFYRIADRRLTDLVSALCAAMASSRNRRTKRIARKGTADATGR